jgi:FlaA1/EpsC-like NDP-sugar epimerase
VNKRRAAKTLLYMVCDIAFLEISIIGAMFIWYGGGVPGSHTTSIPASAWDWYVRHIVIVAPIIALVINFVMRMYANLWRYANMEELLKIFAATLMTFAGIYLFHVLFFNSRGGGIILARRLLFIAWLLDAMLFASTRFGYRALRRMVIFAAHIITGKAGVKRVMVIGAGASGHTVVGELLHSKIRDRIPVIIVDGDERLDNTYAMGVRVITGLDRIGEIADKFRIDEIVIAMPGASNVKLRDIIRRCAETKCTLKILPPESDITNGSYKQGLRDVNIEDIMTRAEIRLDSKNISDYLANKTVMITGGGGTIGSELCRQIAGFKPGLILVYDFYENSAFELETEMISRFPNVPFAVRIGSVLDEARTRDTFKEFRPHVVFHAAAHKHVHFLEQSPGEAVRNNVFGTKTVAMVAHTYGCERFVLISSDKAVNPPNVYGATKRVCEMIVQRMSEKSLTRFVTVRFGNVLFSNGSILHRFKWQIEHGGPVTVTHPDVERFFMTTSEACQLVLQAAGLGKTGLTYVLDMGELVNIDNLARSMIRLSGLKPDEDIKIQYTGLRPGEKLREELLTEAEHSQLKKTANKKIFIANQPELDMDFDLKLQRLYDASYGTYNEITAALRAIEPRYIVSGMDTDDISSVKALV